MTSITIKEYFAEPGSRFNKTDAQKIGPEIFALSEQGAVTPRDIVDAARSSNSALHTYFEWNDQKAADLFRVEQARNMLRSINIRYIEDGQPKQARAFQVVRSSAYESAPRQYRSFEVLYGDSAFAASMMDSAFADLQGWKRKYEPYVEMWVKFGDCFQSVVNQISEFEGEFKSKTIANETDDALARLLAWREECSDALATWIAAREQIEFIIAAIADAETIFAKIGPKSRKCMKCSADFQSQNSGHRLCKKCSAVGSGMDEATIAGAA